jgi:hypothetical protein
MSLATKTAYVAVGAAAGALLGPKIAPAIGKSSYAPAAISGGLGALILALRAKRSSSDSVDEFGAYGLIAAGVVMAFGAYQLERAKADAENAKKQAGAGQMVGAWRAADLKRMAPNSFVRLDQPAFVAVRDLEVRDPNAYAALMMASEHENVDQKLRGVGAR